MSDVAKIGLDVSDVVKSLKLVVKEWQNLRKELSSGALSITINTKSIEGIGKVIADQMKLALASVGTAQQELVKRSAASQMAIGKIAEKGTAKSKKELKEQVDDHKRAAKTIQESYEEQFRKSATLKQQDDAEQAFRRASARRAQLENAGASAPFANPLGSVGDLLRQRKDGVIGLDTQAIREIGQEHAAVAREIKAGILANNKAQGDSVKLWKQTEKEIGEANAAFRKYAATYATLGPQGKKRADAQYGKAEGPSSFFDNSNNLNRSLIRDAEPGLRSLKKTTVELGAETNKILASHKAVGAQMASSIAQAVKWVVLYRVLHTVVNGVQSAMRTLIASGLEYTQQQELQKLGLSGILAENFKLINSQGQELTGLSEILALQRESATQWRQIQSASLAVVGTTADMMLLYSSIVPYASRLGASLSDIQKMTKSTAIAASLMDISFQDARSAIVSLLQGRYLSRNRLVSSLGFTKEEVASLAGTPALFDAINKKLEEFELLGEDASNSLGALRETFKDVIGVVGQAFATPLVSLFKQFMGGVGKGGIMGLLFENSGTELQPTKEILGIFKLIEVVIADAVTPLKAFGQELKEQGSTIPSVITGIGMMVKAALELGVQVAKATIYITKFIAANQTMIAWLVKLGAVAVGLSILFSVSRAINTITTSSGLLATALNPVVTIMQGWISTIITSLIPALGAASGGLAVLRAALITLGTASVIGVVVTGIALLAGHFLRLRDAATQAAEAMKLAAGGNMYTALARITSEADPRERARLQTDVVTTSLKDRDERQSILKDSLGNTINLGKGGINVLSAVTANIAQTNRLQTKLIAQQKAAKGVVGAGAVQMAQGIAATQLELKKAAELGAAIDTYMSERSAELGLGLGTAKSTAIDLKSEIKKLTPLRPGSGHAAANLDRMRATHEAALTELERHNAGLEAEAKAHAAREDQIAKARFANVDYVPERLEEPAPTTSAVFATDQDSKGKEYASNMDLQERLLKNSFDRREIFEAEYNRRRLEMARERVVQEGKFIDAEERKYFEDVAEHNKQNPSAKVAADQIASTVAQFAERRNQQRNDEKAIQDDIFTETALAERKRNEFVVAEALELAKRRADVLGDASEEIGAKYDLEATKLEETMRGLGFGIDAIREAVASLRQLGPLEQNVKALNTELSLSKITLDGLRTQQDMLEQSFQSGSIAVGDYVQRIESLRVAQIAALNAQKAVLGKQRAAAGTRSTAEGIAEVARLDIEMQQIDMTLMQINDKMLRIRNAFQAWSGLSSNLQTITGIFGDWGDKLGGVLGAVDKIVGQMQALIELSNSFKAVGAAIGSIGGGGGGLLGTIGGLFGAKESVGSKVDGLMGGDPLLGGAKKAGGGLMSMASVVPAFAAVSAAISIGSMLFNRSVVKAKEKITKSFDSISDAMESGTITSGEALGRMEAERTRLIKEMSGSKSGRKALKELMPDIENEIDAFKQRGIDAVKAFGEDLKRLFITDQVGDGPLGNFMTMLLDMEKKAQDLLGNLTPGTAEYAKALGDILEMFRLTIADAKRKFQQQMREFEGEALSTASGVLDLMDEKVELYEQMLQLEEEERDLAAETADLEKDRLDVEQKRRDLAEERAKIEQRIADILMDAADAEAAIRREGLVEAQQSVAARKAADISKLRRNTSEQLADANAELAKLTSDTRVQDAINKVTEREENRAEHMREMARSREKLQTNMALNDIRLNAAREIYGMESEIFDVSLDRIDIETRRAAIDIIEAQERVKRWQETRDLIQWIADTANQEGLLNVPPGFPQIRIQIGNITINNQDQSTTTTSNTTTGGRANTNSGNDKFAIDEDRRYPNLIP